MPAFRHGLRPSIQPHIPATPDAMANTALPPSSSNRITRRKGEATFDQPIDIRTPASLSSEPSRPPRSSHFRLTELPLELFARVIMWVAQSAYSGLLPEIVDLRLVCKLFDSEIIHAICALKPLKSYTGYGVSCLLLPHRLLNRVITDKVFSDSNNEGCAIRAIREATDALDIALAGPKEHFKHSTMTCLVRLCVNSSRSHRCLSEITGRFDKSLFLTADEDLVRSCMVAAACVGNIELFDQFRMRIEGQKGHFNNNTNFLGTPGQAALIHDQFDMAAHILKLGIYNRLWASKLFRRACMKGHEGVVQLVLERRTDFVNYGAGFTRAARYGHFTVADKINQYRPISQNKLAEIILRSCSRPNHEQVVRYLYQMGVRSKVPEDLIRAAIEGRQAPNLQVLLGLGEDPNQELCVGRKFLTLYSYTGDPFSLAVASGDAEVMRVLVSHGAQPPDDWRAQRILMRSAIKEQNVGIVNVLAEVGIEKPRGFDKMASKWAKEKTND